MPGAQAGSQNFELLKRLIQTAERGKFDLFFLADAVNSSPTMHPSMVVRLEPITLLAALAGLTTHIGLAATANTTYSEPYNLARLFASLDHLSGGRAAWNVVAGAFPEAAGNFGHDAHPSLEERYARAREFIAVAKGLWDSWEADALLVMDQASGVYIDPDKMHPLDHRGAHFAVAGPLNITRPPQGYPVIMQAGGSELGRDLAAATGEVIYSVAPTLQVGKEFRDDIRRRAEKLGRDPDHFKIMAGVCAIVGESEADARKKLAALGALVDPDKALTALSARLGHDLSGFALDGPLTSLPPGGPMQGHSKAAIAMAHEKNLTISDLRDITSASPHRLVVGTPEQIADELQTWLEAGVGDGYAFSPPWMPGPLDDFVDEVIPILQKRGCFRTEYTDTTLRGHLGLPFPKHPALV